MNKYVKLVVTYVAVAVVIVILYSPGLLALRPTDPGILRPGLAIICAVLLLALLIWRTWVTLKADKYEYLVAGQSDSSAKITNILSRYTSNSITGQAAKNGISELESAQRKRHNLENVIDSKFSKGSLSYEKFIGAVDAAVSTIEKNTALLANRMQAFDDVEYRQLAMQINSGRYKLDNIPDHIQEEKARIYAQQMNEMNSIINANESLLLELDKFSAELSQLDANEANENNESILDELKQLTQEAQYYRSVL